GELKELGRVEGAAAQDHLAGPDRLRPAPEPLDLDTDRTRAVEMDPGHEGAGPDLEVPATAKDRVEVRPGRADPSAAPDVAVERRDPFLAIAVYVGRERVAGLLGRGEPGPEEGACRRPALEA